MKKITILIVMTLLLSNMVKISAETYYYQSGAPNKGASWNTATDGTGTTPTDAIVTGSGHTLVIPSGKTLTLSSNWTIQSSVIVMNGGTIAGRDKNIVTNGATTSSISFTVENGATVTGLGKIGPGSTTYYSSIIIEDGGSLTCANIQYNPSITCNGTITTTANAENAIKSINGTGTITVARSITLSDDITNSPFLLAGGGTVVYATSSSDVSLLSLYCNLVIESQTKNVKAPTGGTVVYGNFTNNSGKTITNGVTIAAPSIALTSAAATANQSMIQNITQDKQITNIVYTYGGTATGYTISWKEGVNDISDIPFTVTPNGKTITISGTAPVGEYTYTIDSDPTSGTPLSGSITVNPFVVSTACNMLTLSVKGKAATLEGTTWSVELPKGTVLGSFPVVFTLSDDATADVTSGDAIDLSSGTATIRVTAQDGTTYNDYIINVTVSTKSQVAYIVNTALSTDDSKLYPYFNNFYDLTIIKIADVKAATAYDFSPYDLVILNEEPKSADIDKLKDISKPLLNMKAYAVPIWWNNIIAGVGNNGKENNDAIIVNEPYHPIFNNVTFATDTTISILTNAATKGIQGILPTGNFNYMDGLIAHAKANSGNKNIISVYERPLSGSLEKCITISIANDSYGKINENGLTLIKNACDYLLDSYVFGADTEDEKLFVNKKLNVATDVTYQKETNGVTINWSAVKGATGYNVHIGNLKATDTFVTGTSHFVGGTTGQEFDYTVEAVNGVGTTTSGLIAGTHTIDLATGFSEVSINKEIASVKYYTLTGIEVNAANAKGVVIIKTTYADGSVSTSKLVK